MDNYHLDNLPGEYVRLGIPLDALAYTEEFVGLVERAGLPTDERGLNAAYTHLRDLRRRGLLPMLLPTERESDEV